MTTSAIEQPTRREGDLWPALRSYWLAVALGRDIAEKPVPVTLLDERLVLVRLGGRVACLRDLCCHRGTPLSLGWADGDKLVCAYHGWSFDVTGTCTRIPSLPPDRPIPARARVPAYRCEERHGFIWVCLDQAGEPVAPIPDCPELADPGYWLTVHGPYSWRCSAARSIENFVDQAHFPWVHEGILGTRDNTETIPVEVEQFGDELRYGFQDRPNPMHPMIHTRRYRLHRPFTIHQRKERDADGECEVAYFTVTPHTARTCTMYLYVIRNFHLDEAERRARYELDEKIMFQDKAILEAQRPEELPLDLTEELHVRGPDAVAIAYRRFLAELGVE